MSMQIFPTLWAKLRNSVTGLFNSGKTSLLTWIGNSYDVWPTLSPYETITKGYRRVSAVFSLVNKDALKFGQITRYVYDKTAIDSEKGVRVKLQGTELNKLLENPNSEQVQSEFFEAARIMFKITGEAFIWLNRGDRSYGVDANGVQYLRSDRELDNLPVLEMYVLPSQFVGIIPDPDNVFKAAGYWLDVSGQHRTIRKGDMIHWKRNNPEFDFTSGNHLRGMSEVSVAACDIDEFKELGKSIARSAKNDGVKGILMQKGLNWFDMTEDQRDAILASVHGRLNGSDVKNMIAMVGGADWDYKNVAASAVDMQTLENKKFKWQELCFHFDVPYNFFEQNAKYDNADVWLKAWVSNSILPHVQRLDAKLSERLTKAFRLENKAEIYADYMALPEMQKNLKELAEAFNLAWYITPNQKLIAMGFEPNKDKLFDEPWLPFGLQPLSQYGQEQEFQNQSSNMNDDEY